MAPLSSQLAQLRSLVALLRPYRARWWLATSALLLGGVVNLALPQAFRVGIDGALAQGDPNRYNVVAGVTALGAVVLSGAIWMRHVLMSWLGNRVVADLRDRTFRHLLRHPPAFFHERRSGELVSRLTSDIEMVQHAVGAELSVTLRSSIIVVGGLAALLWTSPLLTGVMIVLLPPLAVGAVAVGKRIKARSREAQDLLATANAGLKEAITGIETVQTFRAEEREARRYASFVDRAFDAIQSIAWARGALIAGAQLGAYLAIIVILWIGGLKVLDGTLGAGELASFLLYTLMVTAALVSLAEVWGNLQRAAGATGRIFELLDEDPTIVDAPDARPLPRVEGRVRFDGVSFTYPSRPSVTVLRDVSFEAHPGQVVALVGRSGAGKSTIAALVHRFYDPAAGTVSVDGCDLRTVRLADLRRAIGTVQQEPVLFSGTIAENIAYGRAGATDADVRAAAADAWISDFVDALPDGYASMVGERGVKLSGGQRQRIAIARALLADPRILILDEATSHLDSENEALVHAALQRLMLGRTTLVIAHRLNTIRKADIILVLDEGRIVERGTWDELLSGDTVFRRLVGAQAEAGAVLLDLGAEREPARADG
ncbi:MAG: ABC transporter ATP-binding protein [Myxococcales bacterium]